MLNTYFPAVIELSSLNGKNGFKINGEAEGDRSGLSVSNAGDINGDGFADIIIGAHYANSDEKYAAGSSYVLFGHNNTWTTPLELSTLDGANGFKINGEALGDRSGYSVSNAGDINGDGVDDFIIGAWNADPGARDNAGSSYVIFGCHDEWTTPLELSTLDGANGFKINGEIAGDCSGNPVSRAGDINGDGIGDIIIGAHYADPDGKDYAGSSYVVFGHVGDWTTPLELSTLNGINGFKINGEMADDYSGYSMSSAGDINADGIDDFIIGAWGADPDGREYAGSSYVIFGHVGNWITPLELSTLNGTNGFKINGEMTNDKSGYSVSNAGDINGDGFDDFIIGAWTAYPGARSNAGSSYVIFGHVGDWTTPLELSTLNGANGFKINGEIAGDYSGCSVSNAGDINGDGIDDFIIGAFTAWPNNKSIAGSSYVIFGHTDDWTTPLELSTLDGVNGFKVNGEVAGDLSGASVRNTGDINGDGVDDIIIGAYGTDPNGKDLAGSSYIIFGDVSTAEIITNQLIIHEGETKNITLSDLNAVDSVHNEMQFEISALEHGYFENINNAGNVTTSFSKQDIEDNVIRFVHDGDELPPAYNVTIYTEAFAHSKPFVANITFVNINDVPKLNITDTSLHYMENDLAIVIDASLIITDPDSADLTNATIAITNNFHVDQDILGFIDQNDIHGYYNNATGVLTLTGSSSLENYQMALRNVTYYNPSARSTTDIRTVSFAVNDGIVDSNPVTRNINFTSENDPPVLVNNQLTITEGHNVTLTSSELSATDLDYDNADLIFTVSDVQCGQFKSRYGSEEITTFSQYNVSEGDISFVHDGGNDAPSYFVRVSDGQVTNTGGYQSANINFTAINDMPVLVNNELIISQGQSILMTPSKLSATDEETSDDDLVFILSDVEHGHFEDVDAEGVSIFSFPQSDVSDSSIKFVHDGSVGTPNYAVSVSDGALSTEPKNAVITFVGAGPTQTTGEDYMTRIIGASVSGFIGLCFFGIKFYLNYRAAKSFKKMIEEGGCKDVTMKRRADFQEQVLRPISRAIFDRINIKGVLGYIDDCTMKRYLDAVIKIIDSLVQNGVEVDFNKMSASSQLRLINEIARQTHKRFVPDYDCCSCGHLTHFFKSMCVPDVSPDELEVHADAIALAVKASLQEGKLDAFLSRQSVVDAKADSTLSGMNQAQENSIEMGALGKGKVEVKDEILVSTEGKSLTVVVDTSDEFNGVGIVNNFM